jgi:hypothetical protein
VVKLAVPTPERTKTVWGTVADVRAMVGLFVPFKTNGGDPANPVGTRYDLVLPGQQVNPVGTSRPQ